MQFLGARKAASRPQLLPQAIIQSCEYLIGLYRPAHRRQVLNAVVNLSQGKAMNIASRYADNPKVTIDPAKIPEEFRHLLPQANEWSIDDDVEL
jgi:hypothetical protein